MSCRRLPRRLGTAPTSADNDDLFNAQAKCYIHLIFYDFNLFCRPALHVLSALPIPPLDMLGGLALPTRRSPNLRVQIFYLVLCSPPPRHARGLGHANLRVARPVGSYLLLSHAINSPSRHARELAKANTWVAKPEDHTLFTYSSPSTCSGAWLKANLGVVRPEDIVPHEYLPFVDESLLGR
jgi:hypothetical protein